MTAHSLRAEEFRAHAARARDKVEVADLPEVKAVLQRSADSWEAMARLEDAYGLAAALRRGRNGVPGEPDARPYPFAQACSASGG